MNTDHIAHHRGSRWGVECDAYCRGQLIAGRPARRPTLTYTKGEVRIARVERAIGPRARPNTLEQAMSFDLRSIRDRKSPGKKDDWAFQPIIVPNGIKSFAFSQSCQLTYLNGDYTCSNTTVPPTAAAQWSASSLDMSLKS